MFETRVISLAKIDALTRPKLCGAIVFVGLAGKIQPRCDQSQSVLVVGKMSRKCDAGVVSHSVLCGFFSPADRRAAGAELREVSHPGQNVAGAEEEGTQGEAAAVAALT